MRVLALVTSHHHTQVDDHCMHACVRVCVCACDDDDDDGDVCDDDATSQLRARALC